MPLFLVSYDPREGRHYAPVWDLLGRLGATSLLDSLWLVSSEESAERLCDRVKAATESDDAVAVIELSPGLNWATFRAGDAGVAWLHRHVGA